MLLVLGEHRRHLRIDHAVDVELLRLGELAPEPRHLVGVLDLDRRPAVAAIAGSGFQELDRGAPVAGHRFADQVGLGMVDRIGACLDGDLGKLGVPQHHLPDSLSAGLQHQPGAGVDASARPQRLGYLLERGGRGPLSMLTPHVREGWRWNPSWPSREPRQRVLLTGVVWWVGRRVSPLGGPVRAVARNLRSGQGPNPRDRRPPSTRAAWEPEGAIAPPTGTIRCAPSRRPSTTDLGKMRPRAAMHPKSCGCLWVGRR